MAPFDDDTFDIWTISDLVLAKQAPRYTHHFELHPLSWFRDRPEAKVYWDWLVAQEKPIYMQETTTDIPSGIKYPVDEITKRFGTYFTNTISWLIALAIEHQYKEIHLYGVDMAQDTEYGTQRPSCEFFLGWAAGAGIDIVIPQTADLLKCRHLYGFHHDDDFYALWKSRHDELNNRLAQKRNVIDEATREACFLEGALDSQHYFGQFAGQNPRPSKGDT
jgi:hypothetical protein